MMQTKWSLLLILLLLLCECSGLKLAAVVIPQFRFRGHNASLLCKYELEQGEELFSLKWYKEDSEFYRYTPIKNNNKMKGNKYGNKYSLYNSREEEVERGRVQTWSVPGIKIDLRESRPQRVVLKRVSFASSGLYRCEVTWAEIGRGGAIDMKESINRMTVVELPRRSPRIVGGHGLETNADTNEKDNKERKEESNSDLEPGDILNLTCTSAPSNPPAELEWRLNDRKVEDRYVVNQYLVDRHRGLFSSVLGLLLPLEQRHFEDGRPQLTCRGTIAAMLWESTQPNNNMWTEDNDHDDQIVVHHDNNNDLARIKVLTVQESRWPASKSAPAAAGSLLLHLWPILNALLLLPRRF